MANQGLRLSAQTSRGPWNGNSPALTDGPDNVGANSRALAGGHFYRSAKLQCLKGFVERWANQIVIGSIDDDEGSCRRILDYRSGIPKTHRTPALATNQAAPGSRLTKPQPEDRANRA